MPNYASALEIISDVAAEIGIGQVADAFGSADSNIIQLTGLLKAGGRKLVFERDWTHLTKEFYFVTYPNWLANTTYRPSQSLSGWARSVSYVINSVIANNNNWYIATTGGTSDGNSNGPSTKELAIPDGSVVWKYLSTGDAQTVVKGRFAYACANLGVSGTVGPVGSILGATEQEGTVFWTNIGLASEYALPSGFSNMIDQTGWNRTNRLPLGGPVMPQVWQYLKGRQQGVVFNVLFRNENNVFRLYPDTDPPGGYIIAFEYITNFWVAPFNSTVPTSDAPTSNTDVVLFDPLLATRRLKLDWLRTKGFDTSAAQGEYEDALDVVKNADGSAPILNLRGRTNWGPLLGGWNVPVTGFGS